MPETVEVDEQTYRSLEFAARMSGCTAGEVVARLVAEASMPPPPKEDSEQIEGVTGVVVYADYEGHRTQGRYDPKTTRIDITAGPLAGRSFKTPTGAARAVVTQYKPGVSPNRNGWSFWMLDDGSGRSPAEHPGDVVTNEAERQFHRDMVLGVERLKREIGYEATRFMQMVGEHGGAEAARHLLMGRDASDGFTMLWEHGRLEMSVEAHVLLPWYRELFTEEQLETAERRLREHRFDVQVFLARARRAWPAWAGHEYGEGRWG